MNNRNNDPARVGARDRLLKIMRTLGYPDEFAWAIVRNLGTEKTMSRMASYLEQVKPRDPAVVADEMLAIMEDRSRWMKKKEAEYYNSRMNVLMNEGLGVEDDE